MGRGGGHGPRRGALRTSIRIHAGPGAPVRPGDLRGGDRRGVSRARYARTPAPGGAAPRRAHVDAVAVSPLDLRLDTLKAFLNCELADHPVYDGLELQAYDDATHGSGMLAFLSRRADGRCDFYVEPGLRLDRATFAIGRGLGRFGVATFEVAELAVADDGVVARCRFRDDAGRLVEVDVDDRDGRRRRRSRLLAPVGAGVDAPESLMLVYATRFDLVRKSGRARVAIDGRPLPTGRLPLERLHRTRLVKYAADVAVARLCPAHDGPLVGPTAHEARRDGHHARLVLEPPLGDPAGLGPGPRAGAWCVEVDGDALTGGDWHARPEGDAVHLGLDVTRRWRPASTTPLVWLVTRIVPTFRRWPTTYRWRGTLRPGAPPTLQAGWERVGPRDDAYRRATGSG